MNTFLKLGVAGIVATLIACGGHVAGNDPPTRDLVETNEPADPVVQADRAIVHGAPDRGRHPAVVALLVEEGAIRRRCTASVIAPDVLLTARHCVGDVRVDRIECPARVSQVGRSYAAASVSVYLGDRMSSPAAYARSIHVPYTDALCDADIAVVTIDRKLDIAPMRLARSGRPAAGQLIVAVGYDLGARRFRTDVPIVDVTPTELTVGESTRSGDSGGPAIDATTGEVLGVLSRGSGDRSSNVYVRVSAYLDLIDRIVGAPAPSEPPPPYTPPGDMGEPCVDGESCATGLCVIDRGYCSRACGPSIGRCPTGFECARRADATEGVCALKP